MRRRNIPTVMLFVLAASFIGAQAQTIALKTAPQGADGAYQTTSTSFVPVDATNLAYTVTIPTGHKLLINASGTAASTGTTDVFIALFDGSTPLVSTIVYSPTFFNPWGLTWVVNGDGNSHSIKLEFKSGSSKYIATIPYDTIPSNNSMSAPAMTFFLSLSN